MEDSADDEVIADVNCHPVPQMTNVGGLNSVKVTRVAKSEAPKLHIWVLTLFSL